MYIAVFLCYFLRTLSLVKMIICDQVSEFVQNLRITIGKPDSQKCYIII